LDRENGPELYQNVRLRQTEQNIKVIYGESSGTWGGAEIAAPLLFFMEHGKRSRKGP